MKMIIFVVVLTMLINSCCKPKEVCQHALIYDEVKEYAFFIGSYWIYKNDSIGTFDTITVIGVQDTLLCNIGYGRCLQFFRCQFQRKPIGEIYSELSEWDGIYRSDSFELGPSCNIGGNNYDHCTQSVFVSNAYPYSASTFAYKGMHILISINGNYYSNVKEFWSKGANYNASCTPNDLTTFYSPGIGLVKFTETDSTGYVHSFSLIDKNVTHYEINNPCNN